MLVYKPLSYVHDSVTRLCILVHDATSYANGSKWDHESLSNYCVEYYTRYNKCTAINSLLNQSSD